LKIGIVSDIHGNLEALETVLDSLKDHGVERILCLGDQVGYGPDPAACVERIMDSADIVVAGNHDRAVSGLIGMERFNTQAREAIDWTRTQTTREIDDILTGLPLMVTEDLMTAVHASPYEPEAWHYMLTEAEARRGFSVLTNRVCFVGHSHIPLVFIEDSGGNIRLETASSIHLEKDKRYIINVGSVGQPRDNDARACMGLWDTTTSEYVLERLPYPVWLVQEKMAQFELPMSLIERLSFGM
jgi:predicted phosphodiesterase